MSSVVEGPCYGTSISTSVFLITSDGRTLRLPIPSSSPKDPLNWDAAKRRLVLGNLFFFAMLAVMQLQSLGVLVPVMAIDYLPQVSRQNQICNCVLILVGYFHTHFHTYGLEFVGIRRVFSIHVDSPLASYWTASRVPSCECSTGSGFHLRCCFTKLLSSRRSTEHTIGCLGIYVLSCKYIGTPYAALAYFRSWA